MNFGIKSKTISFIGLFFLASISLHSFAHIEESLITEGPQLECQTCHNEISSEIDVFVFIPEEIFSQPVDQNLPQNFPLQQDKPFNSQAPPKIRI
tara:strand:- start:31 stop:315 length:285 start_codon:yes stop_codon:yes gene_type:complete